MPQLNGVNQPIEGILVLCCQEIIEYKKERKYINIAKQHWIKVLIKCNKSWNCVIGKSTENLIHASFIHCYNIVIKEGEAGWCFILAINRNI